MNLLERIMNTSPRVGAVRLIAIDGHGGSGKSTLAELLGEELGASIVHTDDFAGWDNPFDWWPLVIERVFVPIQNGASVLNYPRSKWWENHYPEPVVDQEVTPIMIFEGVGSSRREFREHLSFSIFVDTPKDVCLTRGIERDKNVGKPLEEITEMWNSWREAEEKYMERDSPKENADVVFDGTKGFKEHMLN